MADEGKTFRIDPIGLAEQPLAAGICAAVLGAVLQDYRRVAGPEAAEALRARIVHRVKNNEIGGVTLPADHAIATHVLQVLDLAFHVADQS